MVSLKYMSEEAKRLWRNKLNRESYARVKLQELIDEWAPEFEDFPTAAILGKSNSANH